MTAAVTDELSSKVREFRRAQRPAYECAEAVAGRLRPVTEREPARIRRSWPRERGPRDWFRLPFARFGDRTAFVGSPRASSPECGGARRWAEDT